MILESHYSSTFLEVHIRFLKFILSISLKLVLFWFIAITTKYMLLEWKQYCFLLHSFSCTNVLMTLMIRGLIITFRIRVWS